MHIINIDEDPYLSKVRPEDKDHIFAGHVSEIVGKNFPGTEQEAKNNGVSPEYYDTEEKINTAMDVGELRTIWINTDSDDYTKFSIKISSKDVMTKYLKLYPGYIGKQNFFIVCDDSVLQSHSEATDFKKFFPVDSEEQLVNDFKIWIM